MDKRFFHRKNLQHLHFICWKTFLSSLLKFLYEKYLVVVVFAITNFVNGKTVKQIEANRIVLPNGWEITKIGNSLQLGDLPLNIAVSKSNKYIAVTNNGQSV